MTKKWRIRFNAPFTIGRELENIANAVEEGRLSGDGRFTRICHEWLERHLGCHKALLTHSGTAALEMAAMLCDIGPGDEVIMPSFTFVSTANAFVLRGATPVFVDICLSNLNLNPSLVEQAITARTKVVVPVHYAGIPCDMDAPMDIAQRHGLWVVEDAAHAMLSTYGERPLGSIGHMGCLSFHETKNIISGEGGALLINEPSLAGRAQIIWEKGTNRHDFFRGGVDKYTWVDVGSSFLPSELTAAFLSAQLEQADKIIARRLEICRLYREGLTQLEQAGLTTLPVKNNNGRENGHIFYLLTRDEDQRRRLLKHLEEKGIMATFHYVPLHSSPAGKRFGRVYGPTNVTEDVSVRLVRLPLHYRLTDGEVAEVIDRVIGFFRHSG